MSLAVAVCGSVRPSQEITWSQEDGTAFDLSGAYLSGIIRNETTKATRTITGTLSVVDGQHGIFLWEYSSADVAIAGTFAVQFTAAFLLGQSPAKTFITPWKVTTNLTV